MARRIRSAGAHQRLGPGLVLAMACEVERGHDVEQHPVREELPHSRRLGARDAGHELHELAVARAHAGLDRGVRGRGVALDLEQERVAILEQRRVGRAHGREALPRRGAAAAPRNVSKRRSCWRSWQARKRSRFVLKRRNRYGWEIPASRATASVEVPL